MGMKKKQELKENNTKLKFQLAEKTNQLRIERSLEKVRVVAMRMKKPGDLLNICHTLYKQFLSLGFSEMRNAMINIYNLADRSFINYDYSDEIGKSTNHLTYDIHPLVEKQIKKLRSANDAFSETYFTGKDLAEWRKFRKKIGEKDDPRLDKNKGVYYYFYSIGTGSIGMSTFGPISKEKKELLKRFRNVFNLSYQRYVDIAKAEAQAKEAKIEAALERMRAAAMAIRKAGELSDIGETMFTELKSLGFADLRNTEIVINNDTKETITSYYYSDYGVSGVIDLDYKSNPIVKGWAEELRKANDAFAEIVIPEKEMKAWRKYREKIGYLPDPRLNKAKTVYFYSYSTGLGALSISSFKPVPKEQIKILERFRNVFQLSYQRYTDIALAEAQAREAQVQLAMERVRARTMAMQKSNELPETAAILFEQFKSLGQELMQMTIGIINETDGIIEFSVTDWSGSGTGVKRAFNLSIDEPTLIKKIYKGWKEQKKSIVVDLTGKELEGWLNYRNKMSGVTIHSADTSGRRVITAAFFSKGHLSFSTPVLPVPESIHLLERFAQVFDLTYTRFLDLQKAEAQAREAQIEASLERVRSKTMAMHNSQDVGDTVATMFGEFEHLGIHTNRCGILIFDDRKKAEVWTAKSNSEEKATLIIGHLDLNISDMLSSVYEAWKAKKSFYHYELIDENLVRHYKAVKKWEYYPLKFDMNALPSKEFHSDFFFPEGAVFSFTAEHLSEEHSKILKRFAGVFGQTYRRYLDLQKAEAQAREAQIEASLERVRSKTMAMHSSNDVGDTVATMFNEFVRLDIQTNRCGILIFNDEAAAEVWTARSNPEGRATLIIGRLNLMVHHLLSSVYRAWENKKTFFQYDLLGADLISYYEAINNSKFYPTQFDINALPSKEFHSDFFFPEGAVFAFTNEPIAKEHSKIINRFAGVFGQTYRRYLDLQNAEAQAREAQIEAALERVRARTMAMHNSEDVSVATATMFIELEKLGVENFRGGILNIRENKTMDVWSVNKSADSDPNDPVGRGKTIRASGQWDMTLHPWWKKLYDCWANNDEFIYFLLTGKEKEDYVKILNARSDYIHGGIKELPDCHIQGYYFGEGAVWTFSLQPHSDENKQVMKRFASVFSLTFRRYQDLKKAEAQAREATIEAALEKVRGKAMAMHNSNDLSVTASLVFTELRKLGISPIRCGVGLLSKKTRKAQLYSATSSADGDSLSLVGWVMLSEHPVLENIYDTWLKNEDYYPELTGEQLSSYYKLLLKGLPVKTPGTQEGQKQYGHFLPFSVGCLYAWSDVPYNDEEIKILKRFATIIDLTFRRYIELHTSEANAREAVKQAALDRIRADIASMRTLTDLERITPLIWNELTILGIPFIRCGVFIMDDSQQLIHTFLSTPDGKAIAAFHLPYDTPGNLSKVVSHWKDNKNYIDHWDETAFTELAGILVKQGAITSPHQYLDSIPQGGFHLHFLPFLQGMLYVGNTARLNDEAIKLIQSVAEAFSTAYARYEDFNKLEAAKQQVEKTLTDLKQAQQQLVQSEKMASLGELTAGIAHEIQNPLNFVNNFSDVSNELIDEMMEEVAKGNLDEAKAIADDVKQNLEKISHHGKRADGIVKGMLQHSRTSSGQKELTDINALCDEYLRLAYHGLRAKDKSFNAKFETIFNNNIEKINVVPQEIGRVILNLINNAFYAVTEKKKQNIEGYEPTVIVSTVKSGDKIEVRVIDNGTGIPKKLFDKIFQPFFTTKPTGQGTGLGLSLSYDIIKTHGGELKVETKEGEGSEFIILLPIT
jgi:signal transduction histidine kinase